MTMTATTLATLIIFPAFMAFAAASDLVSMRISNRISLGLTMAFGVFALVCEFPLALVGLHFGTSAVMLAVGIALFAAGWIGGGDAKLAAATALWIGPELLPLYIMIASALGGALTLSILNMRGHPLPGFAGNWSWLQRLHAPRNGVPYGIALSASGLIMFPETAIWKMVASLG